MRVTSLRSCYVTWEIQDAMFADDNVRICFQIWEVVLKNGSLKIEGKHEKGPLKAAWTKREVLDLEVWGLRIPRTLEIMKIKLVRRSGNEIYHPQVQNP